MTRGRRPAHETCGDGLWSAGQVTEGLGLPRTRLDHLLRNALRGERLGTGRFRCFTVEEILTIAVADRLQGQGVRPGRIRAACRYLRDHLRVEGPPLSGYTFFTDGQTVLVNTVDPEVVIDVGGQGQLVFAMALQDIVLACERANFLRRPQTRYEEVVASVRLRWAASVPDP